MSHTRKWGDIMFLTSVVGFTNYCAQMSGMMSRCAVGIIDQGRFKVNVIDYISTN